MSDYRSSLAALVSVFHKVMSSKFFHLEVALLEEYSDDRCMSTTDPEGRLLREQATVLAVAERIRELRKAQGFNQDEFAAQANLYRSHYGFIETTRREPQLRTLIRIAYALDISLSTLLDIDMQRVEALERELRRSS